MKNEKALYENIGGVKMLYDELIDYDLHFSIIFRNNKLSCVIWNGTMHTYSNGVISLKGEEYLDEKFKPLRTIKTKDGYVAKEVALQEVKKSRIVKWVIEVSEKDMLGLAFRKEFNNLSKKGGGVGVGDSIYNHGRLIYNEKLSDGMEFSVLSKYVKKYEGTNTKNWQASSFIEFKYIATNDKLQDVINSKDKVESLAAKFYLGSIYNDFDFLELKKLKTKDGYDVYEEDNYGNHRGEKSRTVEWKIDITEDSLLNLIKNNY